MTNEELAGVDELVGRLRTEYFSQWHSGDARKAADTIQSLIATAREAEALRARLDRLYTIILENSPDTTIADNGMTVWDGLHNEARAAPSRRTPMQDDLIEAMAENIRYDPRTPWIADSDLTFIARAAYAVITNRIEALEAEIERLREALGLADAALRGANMNMNVVERKLRAALEARHD